LKAGVQSLRSTQKIMKSSSKKSGSTSTKKTSRSNKKSGSKSSRKSNSSSSKKTGITTIASAVPAAVVYCNTEKDDAILNTMVSKVVRDEIFPRKQFVLHEKELDPKSKVATRCLKELNMEEGQWHVLKNLVRIRLNRKRNNAQLGVRRSLQSKFKLCSFCGIFDLILEYCTISRIF
jgi:hypothetical protein